MKRLNVLVQITLIGLLAACSVVNQAPTDVATSAATSPGAAAPTPSGLGGPLGMNSSSEEIRLRMLTSHTHWHRLWIDARLTTHRPEATAARQQLWLEPVASSFRMLSGPADSQAARLTVANGQDVRILDTTTGQMQTQPLSPVDLNLFSPPQSVSDVVTPHPLAGQLGTPLASLIFSTELAQRGGTYQPVATEPVAGRPTLVVDWLRDDGSRPSRYWVDVQTAVVLHSEEYGKAGGTELESEIVIDQVIYDPTFAPGTFDIQASWQPVFSDVFGNPLAAGTLPVIGVADDPLGAVYLTRPSGPGATQMELLRLPASCVMGLVACDTAEALTTPFVLPYVDVNAAAAWSAGTRQAVFAFPPGQPNLTASLYLYDVPAGTWTLLAEFPHIDVPLFSTDGQWIAFRVPDEGGVEQEYVIRADGSGLRNLTQSSALPDAERPLVVDGWIGDNAILRSGRPGHEGAVYLVRASDGAVRSLFESQLTKAMFVPSPDGSLLAWAEFDAASQTNTLKAIAPDGSTYRELAAFQGTLYPLVWSPAITHLAFNVYGAPNAVGDEVYIIRRDGRELRQALRSEGVQRLLFSPDGAYLIVAAAGIDPLTAVDLATLRVHVLRLGQSQPDFTWRLLGWAAR
jgi:hypothetical protein